MDSHPEGASAVVSTTAELEAIRAVWATLETVGLPAATDRLLELCREDVESRPYAADGRVLRGHDEIRAFVAESLRHGMSIRCRAQTFTHQGNEVVVLGSIRVSRPDRSFAETQVRWYHRFRDGRIAVMGWEPRAGS